MSDDRRVAWGAGLAGVHGGVILVVQGEVVMIHTGDLEGGIPIDDVFFARQTRGCPTELTLEQLRRLRDLIDQALDDSVR
jgi:hypothetical protein